MKHIYKIDWLVKANRHEWTEELYVDANSAKEAKDAYKAFTQGSSPYSKTEKRHMFDVEVHKADGAVIPDDVLRISAN